jgi:hypothetical protein
LESEPSNKQFKINSGDPVKEVEEVKKAESDLFDKEQLKQRNREWERERERTKEKEMYMLRESEREK